jgi:hypothetical protein
MSVEQLAERLGEIVERKRFLHRVGGAGLGAVLVTMRSPQAAEASHCPSGTYQYHCCCLCKPDDPNCPTYQYVYSCWGWNCGYEEGCPNGHHHCF